MSRAGHLLTAARTGQKMGDVVAVDMMLGALQRFAFDLDQQIKCKTQHSGRLACLGLPSI